MTPGSVPVLILFFFFNDTATTEIYPLSLPDALPICQFRVVGRPGIRNPRSAICEAPGRPGGESARAARAAVDRTGTRLNSSHANISYAVFCLKIECILASTRFSRPPLNVYASFIPVH